MSPFLAELLGTLILVLLGNGVVANGAGETPNFAPFTALEPAQSLHEVNVKVGDITGPFAKERRAAALASARMNFSQPDAAPSDRLNRILWHDARGWGVTYPGVRQAVFFPMSVDIGDEEREEKGAKRMAPRR